MPFQFTLEAVLRYRQSLEDRELLRLQSLMAQRVSVEEALRQAEEAFLKTQVSLRCSLEEKPLAAAELRLSTAYLRGLRDRQSMLRSHLHEVQSAIAGQRRQYYQQRQQREVMESLREAQRRDYLLQRGRREQAELDDLHLLRRRHKPA